MALIWLLTLPAAATVGALAAWTAASGTAGTVLVAAMLIVAAASIYGLSRRKPVTAATVNDAPGTRPVAIAVSAAA
jgi:PiT family inorganic phosphate transporter